MASVPTGTTLAVATAFGAEKTVTAVTNAAEAAVSATAHGFSNGDYVQMKSGWGRLHRRVARVKSVSADSFTLEGINTSNTNFFPAGGGVGTVRKITTWQTINKILRPQASGGDPKNVTVKYLESDVEESINDGFTAVSESFDIDADQVGQTDYEALRALSEVQTDTVLRKILRSGSIIVTPGRVALNENVKFADGQINTNTVAFNANGAITRYAS